MLINDYFTIQETKDRSRKFKHLTFPTRYFQMLKVYLKNSFISKRVDFE